MIRQCSKTAANMNHSPDVAMETRNAAYHHRGPLVDGLRLGKFRVIGDHCYMTAMSIRFDYPATTQRIRCRVGLYTADDVLAGSLLDINGASAGAESVFVEPIFLSIGSLWHTGVEMQIPKDLADQGPLGLTVVYYWVPAKYGTAALEGYLNHPQGIGFDRLGGNIQVYLDSKRG